MNSLVNITVSGTPATLPRWTTDSDIAAIMNGGEMRNLVRESDQPYTYDVIPRLSRLELREGDSFIYASLAIGEFLAQPGHYEDGRLTNARMERVYEYMSASGLAESILDLLDREKRPMTISEMASKLQAEQGAVWGHLTSTLHAHVVCEFHFSSCGNVYRKL